MFKIDLYAIETYMPDKRKYPIQNNFYQNNT